MRLRCAIVVAFLAVGCASTPRGPIVADGVRNYDEVSQTLSRGAQPTSAGVETLAGLGLVTIINLRPEWESRETFRLERNTAGRLMKRYESIPLSNWRAPREADVARILAVIDDPATQPVFVHCQRGADRTGTVIAIYRITHDCWSAEEAIREARAHGMAWWQLPMRRFIRRWYASQRPAGCRAVAGR
jgi:protein tyrosine phosphatase (PTP) superfamily phosphohydrolase (DUF442 family)